MSNVQSAGFVIDVMATAAETDPRVEIEKAEKSRVCVQCTPIPGHPITILDPADPVLANWARQGQTVSFVVRDEAGKVVECRTIHAAAAAVEMQKALKAVS